MASALPCLASLPSSLASCNPLSIRDHFKSYPWASICLHSCPYTIPYTVREIFLNSYLIKRNEHTKSKPLSSYSTVPWKVQYNSWRTGVVDTEWRGWNSYWLEEGEQVGDSRAKDSSVIGDIEQTAIFLMPEAGKMHILIFECRQLEGSYVGELLWCYKLLS